MANKRYKCYYCKKLTPKKGSFVVSYSATTNYVYYFCSWWHFTLWELSKLFRRFSNSNKLKEGGQRCF